MIRIRRGNCPPSLNKPDAQFVEADYKKEDVKSSLRQMQHGKCCYCERPIKNLPGSEREIEHYFPRSSFKDANGAIQWHLANRWGNLLYACAACNGAKLNKYPVNRKTGDTEIINPSATNIDPEDHIDFILDEIVPVHKEKNGSKIGKSTIEKLNFKNRSDLTKDYRKLRLVLEGTFMDLVDSIENDITADMESLKERLTTYMSAHTPFAAYIRRFITERIRKLNEKDIPTLEMKYNKSFDRVVIYFPKGHELRN